MGFREPDEFGGGNPGGSTDDSRGAGAPDAGAEVAAQKEQLLRQILMPEARMRLSNIRMVKPDLAGMVEQQLIALATQGRIQSRLTDEQLRHMLSSIQQPRRDFKINRI